MSQNNIVERAASVLEVANAELQTTGAKFGADKLMQQVHK